MSNTRHVESVEVIERPMSINHFVATLRAYTPVILLSLIAVAVAYVIGAVALYLFSPAQRITSQRFRLDFRGAAEGKYPNGTKFSGTDIISTPILLKVYNDNHFERFTRFLGFSRAIFVLEANPEYERLAADYQGRLSDPRLSAIDRERIQREWEAKAASVAKNDYSLNWLRTRDTADVPESDVRKALSDILRDWADYASTEQHVSNYRVTVLSPEIISSGSANDDPVIAIQVLRNKIHRIMDNVDELLAIPGAELRRSRDGMSLDEIRLRLEEIVRFRLEPLTGRLSRSGGSSTIQFMESQLAYDQRRLKGMQDNAEAIRQSLAAYSNNDRAMSPEPETAATSIRSNQTPPRTGDTLMPQINETFLDRLVDLTSKANDISYRQKLVDDYRLASTSLIPAEQAVTYDQQVLTLLRSGNNTPAPDGAVRNEITTSQAETVQLATRIKEIYDSLSRNLNPSNELYTLTAPPLAHIEHSRSLGSLALYGVLLLAFALPVIVAFCLVHARIREEEIAQEEPFVGEGVPASA